MKQCKLESSYYMKLKLWLQIAVGFAILGGVMPAMAFHWPQCKAGNQHLQALKKTKKNLLTHHQKSLILIFSSMLMPTEHMIWVYQNVVFSLSKWAAPESSTHSEVWEPTCTFLWTSWSRCSGRISGGEVVMEHWERKQRYSLRGRAGTCVLTERG